MNEANGGNGGGGGAGGGDSLKLWGTIAVHNKLMTQAQWDECLNLFNQHGGRMSMGAILLSKRYVSEKHLAQINTKVAKVMQEQRSAGAAGVAVAEAAHAPAPAAAPATTPMAPKKITPEPAPMHATPAPARAPTAPIQAQTLKAAPAKPAPAAGAPVPASGVISVASTLGSSVVIRAEETAPAADSEGLIGFADGDAGAESEDAPRTWKPSDAEWVESSDIHADNSVKTEADPDAIPLDDDEQANPPAEGENGAGGAAAKSPQQKPRIVHDGYHVTEWGRKHKHQKKEMKNAEGDVIENAVDDEEHIFSPVPPGQLDPLAVEMLRIARERNASDVHLASGSPPFFRIHGGLVMTDLPKLTPKQARECALGFMSDAQQQKYLHHHDLDFSFAHPELGRFRVNALEQFRGPDIIFRLIPGHVPTLDELGLPPTLAKFTEWHQGLVLVTGPAGCGKSTTAAALINLVNRKRKDHVITIEDPVEFLHESIGCNITQRQVPTHTKSFAAALRGALREDPDVIQIGEMRDLDTMTMAIRAAETGHLVIGTLQTRNAARTVDRVIDVFPTDQQAQIRTMLSESLRGIISQQLIPLADGSGRACAIEVLFTNTAVSNIIRDNKTYQLGSMMQTGFKQGQRLMDDSLDELVKAGRVTKEEAAKWAIDPKRFR